MKLDDGIDQEELEEVTGPAKSYARYGALGVQMVVGMVVFILGGRWLDKALHVGTPWFTVLGVLLGIIAALWLLFKETRKG
jgi:F0F1-type ATP synthase assembly protein I